MFGIVRLVMGFVVMLLIFLLIRKAKKKITKAHCVVTVLSCLLFAAALSFVPFENLFFSFSTAEDAYQYYYGWNYNVEQVIENESSALVIGVQANDLSTHTCLIIPKSQTAWKLGIGADIRSKSLLPKAETQVLLKMYKHKKSKDTYLLIEPINQNIKNIEDALGSKFNPLIKSDICSLYYIAIPDSTESYWVRINEQQIYLTKTADGFFETGKTAGGSAS